MKLDDRETRVTHEGQVARKEGRNNLVRIEVFLKLLKVFRNVP